MRYGDVGDGSAVKQASEFTFSNNEAMYACTSCGFMSLLTLLWGFAQLQWDDEIDKESERNVWLILGAIVLLGALWSWLVVEPVAGVMQSRTKNVGGRQVHVGIFSQARIGWCVCCIISALGCAFGLFSNEIFNPDGEAEKGFEMAFWFFLAAIWVIFAGIAICIVLTRLTGGEGDYGYGDADYRLYEISSSGHSGGTAFAAPVPDGFSMPQGSGRGDVDPFADSRTQRMAGGDVDPYGPARA